MESTDRKLLRLHVEAVWNVQLPVLIEDEVELLPESSLPDWKLCAAKLADGQLLIWRPDVNTVERAVMSLRVNEAVAASPDIAVPGVHREVALAQRASPWIDVEAACRIARPLTALDRPLLADFSGYDEDYLQVERNPFIGVIIDNRLLSLAHSSRRTRDACELGIDTLPEARRKGYALAATVLWTHKISQEGLVPLYSARADNAASLRLADAAGYRPFAHLVIFDGHNQTGGFYVSMG